MDGGDEEVEVERGQRSKEGGKGGRNGGEAFDALGHFVCLCDCSRRRRRCLLIPWLFVCSFVVVLILCVLLLWGLSVALWTTFRVIQLACDCPSNVLTNASRHTLMPFDVIDRRTGSRQPIQSNPIRSRGNDTMIVPSNAMPDRNKNRMRMRTRMET